MSSAKPSRREISKRDPAQSRFLTLLSLMMRAPHRDERSQTQKHAAAQRLQRRPKSMTPAARMMTSKYYIGLLLRVKRDRRSRVARLRLKRLHRKVRRQPKSPQPNRRAKGRRKVYPTTLTRRWLKMQPNLRAWTLTN